MYKGHWSQINLGLNTGSTTYSAMFSSVNWDHYRMKLVKLLRLDNLHNVFSNLCQYREHTIEMYWFYYYYFYLYKVSGERVIPGKGTVDVRENGSGAGKALTSSKSVEPLGLGTVSFTQLCKPGPWPHTWYTTPSQQACVKWMNTTDNASSVISEA